MPLHWFEQWQPECFWQPCLTFCWCIIRNPTDTTISIRLKQQGCTILYYLIILKSLDCLTFSSSPGWLGCHWLQATNSYSLGLGQKSSGQETHHTILHILIPQSCTCSTVLHLFLFMAMTINSDSCNWLYCTQKVARHSKSCVGTMGWWWFETVIAGTEWDPALFSKFGEYWRLWVKATADILQVQHFLLDMKILCCCCCCWQQSWCGSRPLHTLLSWSVGGPTRDSSGHSLNTILVSQPLPSSSPPTLPHYITLQSHSSLSLPFVLHCLLWQVQSWGLLLGGLRRGNAPPVCPQAPPYRCFCGCQTSDVVSGELNIVNKCCALAWPS